MKRYRRKLVKWLVIFILICVFSAGLWLFLFSDKEAFERQHIEEHLASEYIEELLTQYIKEDSAPEKIALKSEGTSGAEEPYTDDIWVTLNGVTYTPDYAKGRIQCVLKVPSAGINRGVYGGTFEDIYYNLGIWMVVAARPDYKLGQTHYVIYGHNHTTQNLSFNNLKDVSLGDEFTLTGPEGVFTYLVTDIYADWRESVAVNITDNFELPAENCYIVTCGRGENRYKDLVVVGTVVKYQSIQAYAKDVLQAKIRLK